jgi:hypothetical protein
MKTTQSGMRLSQHRQLIFRSLQQERSEWIASFQEAIRSLLSDEMNLVDGVSDGVNGGVPKYEDPATGDSIQYSDVRSPNTGGSLEDMESSRERAPTIVMMTEYNDGPDSFNSDEGGGSIPISRAQSKSTSRYYDSDSEANDDIVGVSSTSHAQFLSRPSSTGRGGSPLGEAHLLQGRVSISRARGLGDTELILLNRISQNVTKSNLKSTASMSQGAVVGSESLEGLKKLLSVCAHVKESLASSSAVPPLSRGLNNHADAVDTSNVVNETVAESTDKLDFKGSAEAAQWAKGVDRLLKKYEKQRSYNIEVLMKLQALERSVYVVCRICTDTTEEVEAVCEVYGDRELGLLGADGEWKSYRFDKVWGIDVPQSQVFKDVEVLLSSVVDGHCACLIGVGDNVSAHRSTSVFGTTNEQGELQPGLAFHSASALWNNMQKTEDSNVIYVYMGEILQNGELVDLLNDVDGGEIDESETSGGIHMTKVKMTSPEQLKEIFKYVLTRRCDGNLVLCFDLFGSDGRLVVLDQGLDDGATVSDGNTANMGAMMQSVSAAVMQLGSFEGDAEPLRTVLGEQSVALAMYCVGNQEASLAATDKYLLHSASMQNKLQTATGQTIVEGQVVQLHMRALKTRIASARQSVESLHADAEHLLFELKKLKEDKSIDIGILNAYEQEVATARRSMDTQVSLLVSGLDQMTDYLREEASARDRHIARLDVIEKEVEALVSSGSDDPTSLKSALVESQTSVEGLLREMHVSIISKILTHNKREKDSFKERKERLSMLEKKQSLKEKPPSLKETSASVKEKSHDNQSQEKMSSGSKRTGGSKI